MFAISTSRSALDSAWSKHAGMLLLDYVFCSEISVDLSPGRMVKPLIFGLGISSTLRIVPKLITVSVLQFSTLRRCCLLQNMYYMVVYYIIRHHFLAECPYDISKLKGSTNMMSVMTGTYYCTSYLVDLFVWFLFLVAAFVLHLILPLIFIYSRPWVQNGVL